MDDQRAIFRKFELAFDLHPAASGKLDNEYTYFWRMAQAFS
ncbi:MAG: hypothetical protein WAM66_02085 [Acidobacteriaceae bacterium]